MTEELFREDATRLECTATVVADPHEIANVLGLAGIEYMLQATPAQPIHLRRPASASVTKPV